MADNTVGLPGNEMGLSLEQLIAALGPIQKVGTGLAKGTMDWLKYPGQVMSGTTPQGANPYDWSAGTALGMVGLGKPGVTGNSFGSGLSLAEIGKKAFHEKLGPDSPHFNPDKPGVPEPVAKASYKNNPELESMMESFTPAQIETLHLPENISGLSPQHKKLLDDMYYDPSVSWDAYKKQLDIIKGLAENNYHGKAHVPMPEANPFEQAAAGNMDALVGAQEKYTPTPDIEQGPNVALDHYQRAKAAKKNLPENPVDEATRQQRRIDAGFTTPAYHGSKGWGSERPERTIQGQEFYSAPPELANMYAGVYPNNSPASWAEIGYDRSSVQPLYLNTKDFHVHDAGGKNWSDPGANNRGIADARNKGAAGVTIKNVYDEPASTQYLGAPKDIHIAFDPTKIRSAFAQFDPTKLHLNDLLAGLGAGAGGGLLLDQAFKQKLLNGDAL
jgi:hypothetical protein